MINEAENRYEKQVIIVDDEPKIVPGQGEGEVPVITIEDTSTDTFREEPFNTVTKSVHRWPWVLCGVIVSSLLCIAVVAGWRYYRTYINIGISVSTTSEQNIAKLSSTAKQVKSEVVMTSDSILGVALNIYELRGLKAEVTLQEPDTTDTSVYLYSRCADYGKNGAYLGSLVMNGKDMQQDRSRLGYCAMANDNVVIGIARDEDVKDYVMEQGGSFFRQFILVSNGVLPGKFHLHGKVERRGLGRLGDKLYYIETKHPETMWDFADALREYGFVDAIYITGGKCYSYYRDAEGKHHDIGSVHNQADKGVVPWVVFKKR